MRKNETKKEHRMIEISELPWQKMRALVDYCPTEIQWGFNIFKADENEKEKFKLYVVSDVFCFPQYCSGTATATLPTEYYKWQDENNLSGLRGHGHSHVFMPAFNSIRDLGYQFETVQNLSENDFFAFLILNKKGDIEATLYEMPDDFDKENIKIFSIQEGNLKVTHSMNDKVRKFLRKSVQMIKPYQDLPEEYKLEVESEFEPKHFKDI